MSQGKPFDPKSLFKEGDIRLITMLGNKGEYPGQLERKKFDSFGENYYWYVKDLTSGFKMGPVSLAQISNRILTEMEVLAWAAK